MPAAYRPLSYLDWNAERRPDAAALVEDGRATSFAALRDAVADTMGALRAHGLERGQVVAVALPNVGAYVALEIAIPALGAVVMPVPSGFGPHELRSALERSGAVLVVAAEDAPIVAVGQWAASVRDVLTLPLTGAGGDGEAVQTGPDDVVQIALTSGPTGAPKLAAFTAELKQATFEGFTQRLAFTPQDRVLPVSPITQGTGEMFLYALRVGATLVMAHEPRFTPEHALALAEASGASVLGGVPTMLSRMLDCPALATTDLGALRLTAVAGAPLSAELAQAWEERTGAPVVSFYGAMDIGQLAVPSPDDPVDKRWHTVGRPHDRAEWAVLAPDGRSLPLGDVGEICMRGPLVQSRSWDEGTGPYDAAGWAHFGDLGYVDDEGYLHVSGRVKDTIIRGGNNINPYEVEALLRQLPAVADVAVVGRSDPDLGEHAVAFVVLRPGAELGLDDVRRFLEREGLAGYKWPEAVFPVDGLPIGPTGKLLRSRLREWADEAA